MRNLNKALTLLVVIAMMMSSVASAASFSDVADDSNYATAIGVGVAFGLYTGYEDGTFQPEGDITRAEFAAIVVRMLGQGDQAGASATATAFTDVPASHWAAGYINIATQRGIINGYGDGTFGPEDKVLYEQAVKMLVVALGYQPTIDPVNGYPVQYLTKAGELGITGSGVKGVNGSPANRGTVAQLVFNSLDVPLMIQSGFGTWLDYVIYDGYGDTLGNRKTVLSEYLGAVKLQVTVDQSSATTGSANKVETITATVLRNYLTKWSDEFVVGDSVTLEVGSTQASSLVGAKAMVYAWYDDATNDDAVIAYIERDTSKANTLVIDNNLLESVTLSNDGKYYVVEYRESENARRTTTVTIDADAVKVYKNNVAVATGSVRSELTGLDADSFYGELTLELRNNTSAYDYDTAFIQDITNFVVESVNAGSKRVTSKNGQRAISFDDKDTQVKSDLYDESGNVLAWTDLKEWDVLSCIITDVNNKRTVVATLVDNSITGTVTAVDESKGEFTIGGTVYKIDTKSLEISDIALGDEGTFYLDGRDRIVYYDTEVSVNNQFAYIVAIDTTSSSIDSKAELKLFLADGTFQLAKTSSKVKVDGISSIPSKDLQQGYTLPAPKTDANLLSKQGRTWFEMSGNAITGVKPVEAGQFITYTVSNNEITSIDRPAADISKANAKGKFVLSATAANADYRESSNQINMGGSRVYINSNTKIMICPTADIDLDATATSFGTPSDDEDSYGLYTLDTLVDETEMTNVIAFNVTEDNYAGAILVLNEVDAPDTNFAALLSATSALNASGDSVYKLFTLRDGVENKDGLLTSIDYVVTGAASDFAEGQIAIPSFNPAGAVRKWDVLAAANNAENKTITDLPGATRSVEYFGGRVTKVAKNSIEFVSFDTLGNYDVSEAFIPAVADIEDLSVRNADIYIYDENIRAGGRVSIGDLSDIVVDYATSSDAANYDVEVGQVIYDDFDRNSNTVNIEFVAREVDGVVVEVMFYIYK